MKTKIDVSWAEEHRKAYEYGVLAAAEYIGRCCDDFHEGTERAVLKKFNITKKRQKELTKWMRTKLESGRNRT